MTLSITQRLTLTVAVLSALILTSAAAVLFWTVRRAAESRGIEQARMDAFDLDSRIWTQLDEDIMADFVGVRVLFDQLSIPSAHWAVVRGDGRPEMATGLFQDYQAIQADRPADILKPASGMAYAVASTPLIPERQMRWADIPEGAQRTVLEQVPEGDFLWAKSDVAGSHFVFAVQMLHSSSITEVQVTNQGQHLQTQTDPLPTTLPAGMEARTPAGEILRESRIVGWRAANSELIALVRGQSPEGRPLTVAVNRLGEHYGLEADGAIGRRLDPSRLWVVVAHDLSPDMKKARLAGPAIVAGGLMLWSLMVSIAWLVTRRALKPVNEMVTQAGRIDSSKLNERLPMGPADDELRRVARTVNKMLDRIQEGYLREQRFTADASHEMRNPLAKMTAEIDLALSRPRTTEDHEAAMGRLRQYTRSLQRLVDSLLMLAQLDGGLQTLEVRPFDVADLAVDVFKTLPTTSAQRVQLALGEPDRPMRAIGHRELIGVLLGNLLDNALRYSPADATVDLRVHAEGNSIRFEVEDRGPGIPAEQRRLIFHRFYRLEKSRSKQTGGAGLGLSIVKAIADVHQTEINLSRSVGQSHGTVVAFTLPACQTHGG